MRSITLIIIHCSAVRPWQQSSAEDIDKWHKDKHWKGIGYHYVVRRDGSIELGRPLEEADTRTPEQRATLRKLVELLHQRFPRAVIVGHHDLNPGKKCPCYNVVDEYRDMQPP